MSLRMTYDDAMEYLCHVLTAYLGKQYLNWRSIFYKPYAGKVVMENCLLYLKQNAPLPRTQMRGNISEVFSPQTMCAIYLINTVYLYQLLFIYLLTKICFILLTSLYSVFYQKKLYCYRLIVYSYFFNLLISKWFCLLLINNFVSF